MRVGQNLAANIATQTTNRDKPYPVPVSGTVEEGFFRCDHDLNLRYVEPTPNSRLWAPSFSLRRNSEELTEALIGQNVWDVLTGSLRSAFFAAYKRLLTDDSTVVWEGNVDNCQFLFRTFVTDKGFGTYYRVTPKNEQTIEEASEIVLIASKAPRVEAESSDSEDFFLHSADIMCVLDESGGFERLNPTGQRLLGSNLPMDGTTLFDIIHPDERANAELKLSVPATMLAKENGQIGIQARCLHADGEYRWLQWSISVNSGKTKRFFATARDITVLVQREEEMSRQAQLDPLTGLPNRLLLQDRLHFCLAAARRRRQNVAVLFIDLDRFKKVNDTFGHAAGDQLLVEIAERMRRCLRDEDMVARLGGDEFVIILPQVKDTNDAIRVANKLLGEFDHPFDLRGNEVTLSVSIGICLAPQFGDNPDELIRHADEAMYHAKSSGRGAYAVYESAFGRNEHHTNTANSFTLETRLSKAIERNELLLHYQPQVDLRRGRVIGVEALMRWNPAEMEQVSPATFIPLAEETGLIVPLGTWAVEEACNQAVDWYRAGFPVQMSVNLASAQLSDRHFPDKLNDYLTEKGLPADMMDLELTERTFIDKDDRMISVLNRLRDMGVHLSVDDFGTKYSSLPYLRHFPIDGVKVDRSFVTSIADNKLDEALVKAIIDLSHTLGLKVIAEGVETIAQRDCLYNLGCDVMQGHLFSAAVPPGELSSMLRQSSGSDRR